MIMPVHEMDQEIPSRNLNPHYTDSRFFNRVHTVFLRKGYETHPTDYGEIVDDVFYVYSDRIFNYKAWDKIKETGANIYTARACEDYLQEVYQNPKLELVHIITGVNVSNGFPYRVYGIIEHKEQE